MELFFREFAPNGSPLIIIHGLYGASDNWLSICRKMESRHHIVAIDQRNHGQSPHSPVHTYESMTQDLHHLLINNNLTKVNILGHSMGGKTAMQFALKHPQLINNLIILDIAPKSYAQSLHSEANNHKTIINSLSNLPIDQTNSRAEIDKILKQTIKPMALRSFLLKNLKRQNTGGFSWKFNLEALQRNLPEIMDGFSNQSITKNNQDFNTTFIKGENSDYFQEEDLFTARKFFPDCQLITIENASHWIHHDQPELLTKTINYLLEA